MPPIVLMSNPGGSGTCSSACGGGLGWAEGALDRGWQHPAVPAQASVHRTPYAAELSDQGNVFNPCTQIRGVRAHRHHLGNERDRGVGGEQAH